MVCKILIYYCPMDTDALKKIVRSELEVLLERNSYSQEGLADVSEYNMDPELFDSLLRAERYESLLEQAETEGITEESLDSSVADIIYAQKFAIYKSESLLEFLKGYGLTAKDNLDDETLIAIDEVLDAEVADVKDSGVEGQVEFLYYQLGEDATKAIFADLS